MPVADVLSVLDNREQAILVWATLGLTLAMFNQSIRGSIVLLVRTFFSKPLLIVLILMVGYVVMIVFASRYLGLWNVSMTKDTVKWFFGQAFVMWVSSDQANKDDDYFKTKFLMNVRFVILLEFLVNFYVFNIFVELVLVPFITFIAIMLAFSETKREYRSVKQLMQFVMTTFGLALLFYISAMLITNLSSFVTLDNLRLLILPIALTVLFLPFIYALAVYSGYELIFLRVQLWKTDDELARFTRRAIFRACLFRLRQINRFLNHYAGSLHGIRSTAEVTELLADFRTQQSLSS